MEFLIECGANVNARDYGNCVRLFSFLIHIFIHYVEGQTPLHTAYANRDLLNHFFKWGAKANVKDNNFKKPSDLHKDENIVSILHHKYVIIFPFNDCNIFKQALGSEWKLQSQSQVPELVTKSFLCCLCYLLLCRVLSP